MSRRFKRRQGNDPLPEEPHPEEPAATALPENTSPEALVPAEPFDLSPDSAAETPPRESEQAPLSPFPSSDAEPEPLSAEITPEPVPFAAEPDVPVFPEDPDFPPFGETPVPDSRTGSSSDFRAEAAGSPSENAVAQPETKKHAGKQAIRGLRAVLSFLLCVILFLSLLTPLMIYDIRSSTDQAGLENLLKMLRPSAVPAETLVAGALPGESLTEWYCRAINVNGLTDANLLETFLERSTLWPFLAEKLSAYFGDVYAGVARTAASRDEVEALLLENSELFRDIFDLPLTRQACEHIAKLLDEAGILEYTNTETLKYNQPVVYYALHIGLSWYTAIGFLALALLCFLGLIRSEGSALKALRDLSACIALTGGVAAAGALSAKLLPGFWQRIAGGNYIAAMVSGEILFTHLALSFLILVAGIVLLLIFRLVFRVSRWAHRKRHTAEEPV